MIISLSIHEFGHAFVAWKLGDSTARQLGRVTLNPLNHLDPMGTIMLVVLAFQGVGLGWAKPVPVNPYNLENPRRDMAWISFAGPASNFIQALLGAMILVALLRFQVIDSQHRVGVNGILFDGLRIFVSVNISLFFFNMLPIYPLDGSKIVAVFLPAPLAFRFEKKMIEWGMKPFIVLIVLEFLLQGKGMGPLSLILRPLINYSGQLLYSLAELIFTK